MPNVVCQVPIGVTHEEARDVFKQVKKEMKGLQESAYRREAARRMGLDYDTYLAAWKGAKGVVRPKAAAAKAPKSLKDAPTPKVEPEPKPIDPKMLPKDPRKPSVQKYGTANYGHKVQYRSNYHDVSYDDAVAGKYLKDEDIGYLKRVNRPGEPGKDNWQIFDLNGRFITETKTRGGALNKLEEHHQVWKAQQSIRTASLEATPYRAAPEWLDDATLPRRTDLDIIDGDSYDARAREALRAMDYSNPGINTDPQFGVNCIHVVQAHELRRRGFDVMATKRGDVNPYSFNGQIGVQMGWRNPDGTAPLMRKATVSAGPENLLVQLMLELPEGGRAWVVNHWKAGGGHIFNVEKIGDRLYIYESQRPHLYDMSDYLDKSMDNIWWVRADTLRPIQGVDEFVKPRQPFVDELEAKKAAEKSLYQEAINKMWWRRPFKGESLEDRASRLAMQPDPPKDWTPKDTGHDHLQ